MKHTSVALGILGLVWAAAMPGASAAVLLKDDFSTGPFKGVGTVYMQGVNGVTRGDDTVARFFVEDGELKSISSDGTSDSDADTVSDDQGDPPGVRTLLLTGDPTWADVAVSWKIRIEGQNTGAVGIVLRAAAKTKPADPDSWYELRYSTGVSPEVEGGGLLVPIDEVKSGIKPPTFQPAMVIMKVVKGKWTQLATTTEAQAATLPGINAAGDLNADGAYFRFTAKGSVLTGAVSTDAGKTYKQVLQASDSELTAGLIGVEHFDYGPQFDDLLVDMAP